MELSEKIIPLSGAARSLRPVIDSYDRNETEDERKKRRLMEYSEAAREFFVFFQTRQPFYPEEIFKTLNELGQKAHKEAIQYAHADEKDRHDKRYWDNAVKSSNEIFDLTQKVMGQIRDRVKYWEEFEFKREET